MRLEIVPNEAKYYIANKQDQSVVKGALWGLTGIYFAATGLALTAMNIDMAVRGALDLLSENSSSLISPKALIAWTLFDLVIIKIATNSLKNAAYHLGSKTHIIKLTELKKC